MHCCMPVRAPIPDSIFYIRLTESVKMMECVICVSLWEARHWLRVWLPLPSWSYWRPWLCRHHSLHVHFFHPAWLWTPNQTRPSWLSHPCRSRCHVACSWLRWAFVFLHCFFFFFDGCFYCVFSKSTRPFMSVCVQVLWQQSRILGHEPNWTLLFFFPSPLLAWASRDWIHAGMTVLLVSPMTRLLLVYTPFLLWHTHTHTHNSTSHWDFLTCSTLCFPSTGCKVQ